jgi:hypothetical protein
MEESMFNCQSQQRWPVIDDDNEDNFRNWPQVNPDYFKLKKKENSCYVVRADSALTDKYSLSLLGEVFTSKVPAEMQCELPPMSTAYGVKVKDS